MTRCARDHDVLCCEVPLCSQSETVEELEAARADFQLLPPVEQKKHRRKKGGPVALCPVAEALLV